MSNQLNFSDFEYSQKRKKQTRREIFLEKMDSLVPYDMFCDIIQPYYYKIGNGRQPTPLLVMVKMYLISIWYTLSDEATEDMLYENQAVRKFVGVDCNSIPDETTLCKFRHLLERNNLNHSIFKTLTNKLSEIGILLKEGTIVDATIIEAPRSKKNKDHARDPQMGSTTKGSQYYFGMKAHIGVDKDSGLVHSLAVTPANVPDIDKAGDIVHGEEKMVCGDAGYIGIEKRQEVCEKFQDGTGRKEKQGRSHGRRRPDAFVKRDNVTFQISRKRKTVVTEEQKAEEIQKSKIRARVEHVFGIIKHVFRFRKVQYRTLAKNENKLLILCTLANIHRCGQMKMVTI